MLIKEYRIPMPMSVEEYRIAQLYMIQVREIALLAQTNLAVREPVTLAKYDCCVNDHEMK